MRATRNYLPAEDVLDLDGYRRLFGKTTDIGAYEYQGLSVVYRFWSAVKRRHFYTILGSERDKLIRKYPAIWQYEGVAYWAFYGPSEPDLVPVYRFWSASLNSHVWTTDEDEKNRLQRGLFPTSTPMKGSSFYAYPEGNQPLGTVPVYRFWSDKLSYHFYTMKESEKDKLISSYSDVWTYEGVVWYIHPRPYQLQETGYQLVGEPDDVSYTMTLSAYVDGKEAQINAPQIAFTPNVAEMQMTIGFSQREAMLESPSGRNTFDGSRSDDLPNNRFIDSGGGDLSASDLSDRPSRRGPSASTHQPACLPISPLPAKSSPWKAPVTVTAGRVTFSDQTVNINATAETLSFDLESYGNVRVPGPVAGQDQRLHAADIPVEPPLRKGPAGPDVRQRTARADLRHEHARQHAGTVGQASRSTNRQAGLCPRFQARAAECTRFGVPGRALSLPGTRQVTLQ